MNLIKLMNVLINVYHWFCTKQHFVCMKAMFLKRMRIRISVMYGKQPLNSAKT